MKHLLAGLACVIFLGSVQAGDGAPAADAKSAPRALDVRPEHRGYDFDQPQILLRQRLFGLAHGLSLLAAACLDLPEHSAQIQDAYASWHARQARTIESVVLDLAAYYFGARAAEARWPDLVHALNLKDNIEAALGRVDLAQACATLPAAIVRPRYELDTLLSAIAAPAEGKATAAAAGGDPGAQSDVAQSAPAPTSSEPQQ